MTDIILWLLIAAAIGAGVMGVFGLTIQCISVGVLALGVLSLVAIG
jgi:hypothetical protein